MKILITGGAGMIGQRLARQLATTGELHREPIEQIVLFDVVPPTDLNVPVPQCPVVGRTGDLADPDVVSSLLEDRPDLIYHLAAIVSGQAELDFELGYRINLDGTRALLEAARRLAFCPRFLFASSIAVFGAPFPPSIPDEFCTTPLTSYGTQKAIGELLVSDYGRRGWIDGLSIRLPTICVRPGKPNAAASGFFSNIIREPLNGLEAILPVSDDVLHWHASPRAAVRYLIHAASLTREQIGTRRAITLPGVAATVGEQIAALKKVAGDDVVGRIRRVPDPMIQQMVAGWPRQFQPHRALQLGFVPDNNFEEIIRIHVEDELGGRIP